MELSRYDFTAPLTKEQTQWAEQLDISIIVMGPVNPIYGWFGHAAIMVRQPEGHSLMFDYGIFDNTGKDFYLNFLRGRMLYSVWVTDGDWRIEMEKEEGRSLIEYSIDLTPEAKMQVLSFLKENIKEENKVYLYHFFKDNCATRLRDILDAATEGDFSTYLKGQGTDGTYRSWAEKSMCNNVLISFLLNFLMGNEVDEPISMYDQTFLPERLGDAVMGYEPFHTTKTVLQEQQGNIFIHTEDYPSSWGYPLVGILFAFLVCVIARSKHEKWGKWTEFISFLVLTILGFMLFWCDAFSDLDVTWWNENLLFINPLLSLGCIWIWRHPDRVQVLKMTLAVITIVLVLLKGLFPDALIQDNLMVISLVLPYYATGFMALSGKKSRSRRKAVHEETVSLPSSDAPQAES